MAETPRSRIDETKLNCWEYAECGRGPRAEGPAMCRAARESLLDGVNGGQNAGRACWAVAGSLGVDQSECGIDKHCSRCQFRRLVVRQELPELEDVAGIVARLGYFDVLGIVDRPEIVA